MKTAKMTQKQMKELLGITSSPFQRWLSDENNPKHNLALIVSILDYEECKKLIKEGKEQRNKIFEV